MSMKSWSEYGYGFDLWETASDNSDVPGNFEKVKNFIILDMKEQKKRSNPKFYDHYDEKIAKVEKAKNPDEIEEVCDSLCHYLAGAINIREGITVCSGFMACGDTDMPERIGICQLFPWEYDERSKSLTEEDAFKMMKKYADYFGVTEDPDFFEQEYYG